MKTFDTSAISNISDLIVLLHKLVCVDKDMIVKSIQVYLSFPFDSNIHQPREQVIKSPKGSDSE